MRAPQVYIASVLITIFILLAAGHAQTSKAQTGPEATNSQDANPKPSNAGRDTATGAVPDSANNPGQPASGKMAGQPSPAVQRATPAIPATDDQNSPLLTAPIQSQAEVPQSAFFEFLFNNVSALSKVADSDDKAGKHTEAALWRTHDQRAAGLNDAEGKILQEIAHDCLRALKEQDAKMQASAEKFRAHLAPGAPIQIPPELVQMFEDRKAIVRDHIETLREALGNTSFSKLDSYVHSSFHAQVIESKPTSTSTTIIEKSQKESR
ncbi:MAG TPA: hypothetical protein VFF39_01975 [Verrucomicrobiae bacterium]|nr:hypothetical protein [Verrucomicrobiae bacterium]